MNLNILETATYIFAKNKHKKSKDTLAFFVFEKEI